MTTARLAVAAAIAALALLTFFQFPGHTYLASDTQIYLPMLEHIWDPTALPDDIAASRPHLAYTLYDEIAIGLRWATHASFEWVLTGQQLLFRALGIWGIYLLARTFPLSRANALMVAAFASLGASVVGPAVLTIEYEPVPRGFAIALSVLALGLTAQGRIVAAGCAAALAFVYHPPAAAPFCFLFLIAALWTRDFRALIPLSVAIVLLLIFSRLQSGAAENQVLFGTIDPWLEKLQRMRAPYNWVSTWGPRVVWQYVFLWLVSLIGFVRARPRQARFFLVGLPFLGMLSMPLSFVLLENCKWAIIPQFQPGRGVLYVTLIAILLSAAAGILAAQKSRFVESALWFVLVFAIPGQARLWELFQPGLHDAGVRRRILLIALLAFASTAVFFLARYRRGTPLLAALAIAPFFLLPGYGRVKNYNTPPHPELDQLCLFAATHTPKDAVFLFPDAGETLSPGIFRVQALRSVYVDWKSGGQVNYYQTLAEEWWTRWQTAMTRLGKGRALAPADLDAFAGMGVQYVVVSPAHAAAGRPVVYRNSKFVVFSSTSARVGMEACAPARVTEIAAAALAKRSATFSGCSSASATARAALNVSPAAVVSLATTGKPGLKISASPSL